MFTSLQIRPRILVCLWVRSSIVRRVVGMSEETYLTVSRWSWLIILVVLNLGLTRHLIALTVSEACVPYALLCGRLNPTAFSIIFQP